MILVDTSVWVDHLRSTDTRLQSLLENVEICSHPFVVGELAMGALRQRELILRLLRSLPQARVATPEEVLEFVRAHKLFGLGIGYIDAHLLASTLLSPGTTLWSRDKRLMQAAKGLNVDVVV